MKKVTLLFLISSLSLALVACNTEEKSVKSVKSVADASIETIVTHGNYVEYEKEIQLYKDAELIVIGQTDKKFTDRKHVVKYVPSNEDEADLPKAIEDFYTETPITITKVLKQSQSTAFAENDEIDIIEPVSLLEEDGLKKLSVENYLEMQEGKNYIIYLKKNTYGEYGVINMNNGRFKLEDNDQIVNLTEHGHDNDIEKHGEMKRAVESRFEKEINEINVSK